MSDWDWLQIGRTYNVNGFNNLRYIESHIGGHCHLHIFYNDLWEREYTFFDDEIYGEEADVRPTELLSSRGKGKGRWGNKII